MIVSTCERMMMEDWTEYMSFDSAARLVKLMRKAVPVDRFGLIRDAEPCRKMMVEALTMDVARPAKIEVYPKRRMQSVVA